jgi:hypothetical protein
MLKCHLLIPRDAILPTVLYYQAVYYEMFNIVQFIRFSCAPQRGSCARRDILFAIPAPAGRRLAVARSVLILFVREIWRNPGASCSMT